MSVEIHQAKEVLDREIKLIPTLRHDSLHYQNIKVELLNKERDEKNSMMRQIQDSKQEVEVTEHRLNNVTKVNDEEITQYKEKIYNLSQVSYQHLILNKKFIPFKVFMKRPHKFEKKPSTSCFASWICLKKIR